MNIKPPGAVNRMLLELPGAAGIFARTKRDTAIALTLTARNTIQRMGAALTKRSGFDEAARGVSTLTQPRNRILVVHGDPAVGNNGSEGWTTRMIKHEISARGGTPSSVPITGIAFDGQTLHINGVEQPLPEAIIVRRIPRTREPNADLMRLQAAGVHVTNTPQSLEYGHKGAMDVLFAREDIPHLDTAVADTMPAVRNGVAQLGVPMVMKDPVMAGGIGVHLADDVHAVEQLAAKHFATSSEPLILQPFYRESEGRSVRVLMMRTRTGVMEPIAGMAQHAPAQDFRTNSPFGTVQQRIGVTGANPELSSDALDLARRVSEASGLDTCGVDLIWTNSGWKVVEINPSPGLIELGIPLKRTEQMIPNLVDYAMWGPAHVTA